ncbi:hypothetical protein, partial [Bradyrhizobium liaoningense]|uniref:hypothetical protein n=1 Tax=Bradyrhizobium liaoningense TaxID=43992 RepID=UPI001BA4C19F
HHALRLSNGAALFQLSLWSQNRGPFQLPSIAFLRNVSLCLSFADALAIEIAIKVAVPSDISILFIGNSCGLSVDEHA